MALLDWLPALTSTGGLAVVLWLGRNLIATRLTKSVEHEFNKKLEEQKADQRRSEEHLKSDLRAKESQIVALQSGALIAMASRQQAVDKRRLEAVDQLWASVLALGPARAVATMMVVIKFEAAAKETERNPEARELFKAMSAGMDPKNLDTSSAQKARPFLSPVVWATFSAYTAVCMHAAMRMMMLRSGMGAKDYMDSDSIKKLIVAALPHYKEYIDEHGPSVYNHVLDALESKLLQDIQAMLKGTEGDREAIAQAAEIVKLSAAVVSDVSSARNAA